MAENVFRLIVVRSAATRDEIDIHDKPIVVGRGLDCDIEVDENKVSRNHCVIFVRAGALYVRDQGSSNGTQVNGKRITQTKLSHGDRIELGSIYIQVKAVGGPAEPKPLKLSLVNTLGAMLSGSQDLNTTAKAALGLLHEMVPVDRSCVLLKTDDDQPPVLAFRNKSKQKAEPPAVAVPIAKKVWKEGIAYYSSDITADQQLAIKGAKRPRAVMCAPLEHKGEVMGAVYADCPRKKGFPDAEVRSLFDGIANQSALALARAGEHVEMAAGIERLKKERDALAGLASPDKAGGSSGLRSRHRAPAAVAEGLVSDAERLKNIFDLCLSSLSTRIGVTAHSDAATHVATKTAERLVSLAHAVVTSMKIESDTLELTSEHLDTDELIAEAVRANQGEASALGVTLSVGQVDSSASIVGDDVVIEDVLNAVINRALYLGGSGGQVTVQCHNAGAATQLEVIETGSRGKEAERARLVAAWEKDEPPPKEVGAGLTFCRLALEAHGGRLHCSGGREATVWVLTLPSASDDDMEQTVIADSPFIDGEGDL